MTVLRRYRYWLIALVTALGLWLSNGSVGIAQSPYPPFLDPHVNDYGQVLRPEDATQLRTSLHQFQTQTGIQVVVMTVNSIHDYRTGDETIESFATNLFNTWGIGDRTRNDGILILVAPGDRQVRIELGSGYSSSYDQVAQEIINTQMLLYFREGSFSQGAVAGANAVMQRFHPNAPPPAASTSQPQEPVTFNDVLLILRYGIPRWVWGVIAGVGTYFVSIPIIQLWLRYRQRRCPRCRGEMVRLDEQADDQYLAAGQRTEESLRSVDYDVWLCQACGHHLVKTYRKGVSRFRECPGCHYRALEVERRTVRQPTYTSEGERQVIERCRHCSHHRTYYETISRLTDDNDSSSSSSGSSCGGGGSSSGGGASGSW